MKEFTIGKNDAGQRLDRWLAKTLPLLPAPLAQKYIRLKRVKVNGKGSQRDVRLQLGDILQLYINDEFFEQPREENAFLSVFKPHLDIVYEDGDVVVLNKAPGVPVHPGPGHFPIRWGIFFSIITMRRGKRETSTPSTAWTGAPRACWWWPAIPTPRRC